VSAAVTSAVGVIALAFAANPAVVVGMAIFGAGWGASQNATLALMLEKVSSSRYGTVSTLWYVAYDAGLALDAAGFGVVAARTDYPATFALTAALVVAAMLPALHDLDSSCKP